MPQNTKPRRPRSGPSQGPHRPLMHGLAPETRTLKNRRHFSVMVAAPCSIHAANGVSGSNHGGVSSGKRRRTTRATWPLGHGNPCPVMRWRDGRHRGAKSIDGPGAHRARRSLLPALPPLLGALAHFAATPFVVRASAGTLSKGPRPGRRSRAVQTPGVFAKDPEALPDKAPHTFAFGEPDVKGAVKA